MQKLLQSELILSSLSSYYVHPQREFAEYLSFLYAIIDDTDLLTKVTNRDVECVAALLNKLKSLMMRKEVEIIHLDSIEKNSHFAKTAAKRILQNEDMYSLYKKIYEFKEEEIETNLTLCAQNLPSNIFADTKEQNGCCRVGQTKMFAKNFETFSKYVTSLRKQWLNEAEEVFQSQKEIDFHLHMISTIAGADEVYQDNVGNYTHQDEIWIWTPHTQQAYDRLASFLSSFQTSPDVAKNLMEVELLGPNAKELESIFLRNFSNASLKKASPTDPHMPIALIRFTAGTLNSRKSMITPYLPRMIS